MLVVSGHWSMVHLVLYLGALCYSYSSVRHLQQVQRVRDRLRLNTRSGIKPLSIYGLVHLFRPGKGSLVDGNFALSPEERDRTVGILREHLLDVEDIGEGDGTSSSRYSPVSVSPQSSLSQHDLEVQK